MSELREGISRRALLAGSAASGAALALGAAPWARARHSRGELGRVAARRIDAREFTGARTLERWQRELDRMGLRAAASRANEDYIDVLAERLERAGIRDLTSERVPIERWTALDWSLELFDDARTALPTTSFINYSGETPPDGVHGELVRVDPDATPAPGSLAGKVALFDVPLREIPNLAFKAIAYEVYDPREILGPDGTFAQWQPGQSRKTLDALAAAGAIAAIGIVDLPVDAAKGGFYPYDGVIRSVPGVFVNRPTGRRLQAAAAVGGEARIRLRATVKQTSSRNLLGLIPGRSRELMILNSHTDGPNAIEDNGPNAIVALSRYLTRLPRRSLPRSVLVSLTTGHFHGAAGQEAFIELHRDDLIPRTAAALTLEHLGALEFKPEGGHSRLTGDPAAGLFFVPETSALVDAAARAVRRARSAPTLIARPITVAPTAPDGRGFPAEGNALWTEAAIPTANFIAGPTYLFNAGRSTMGRFDAGLMRRQAIAFAQMLLDLGAVPRDRLRDLDLL